MFSKYYHILVVPRAGELPGGYPRGLPRIPSFGGFMFRSMILLLALGLGACTSAETVLPDGGVPLAANQPPAMASIARYNGKPMRMRAFVQRNGVKQLVGSRGVKFTASGNKLGLVTNHTTASKLFIGKGVELAYAWGNEGEELPLCDMGTPLNEQPPCRLPWCEDVDFVQPCDEYNPGGGVPDNPYDVVLADSGVVAALTGAFTAVATMIPTPPDSITGDTVAVFASDTNGVTVVNAYSSEGLLVASVVDFGDMSSAQTYNYSGGTLTSIVQATYSSEGDSIYVELTPELDVVQLRMDAFALSHASEMFDFEGCWDQTRGAILGTVAAVGAGAVFGAALGAEATPIAQGTRMAVAGAELVRTGIAVAAAPTLATKALAVGKGAVAVAKKVVPGAAAVGAYALFILVADEAVDQIRDAIDCYRS